MDGLPDGDQQVDGAKAGDGSAEVGIVPDAGQRWIERREVIQSPGFHPGEHDQESADFKGEDLCFLRSGFRPSIHSAIDE